MAKLNSILSKAQCVSLLPLNANNQTGEVDNTKSRKLVYIKNNIEL